MSEPRRIRKVGNSYVVALPQAVRQHLGLGREADIYFHRLKQREVLITRRPVRSGGRPGQGDAEAQLDQARAEIDRLRKRLEDRPAAVYREGFNAGFMQGLKWDLTLSTRLAQITAWMQKLDQTLSGAPRPALRVPPPPPARARSARPSPTPAPEPPSLDVVAGGDAASGGATPQAAHE